MIRVITSITAWNDAVGKRVSITYSEVDEKSGKILADNKRMDRVVTDDGTRQTIDSLMEYGQSAVDSLT